jgi:hypothetical protein
MGKSNPMKRGAFYHLACVKQELKSGAEVTFLVSSRDFAGDEIGVHGFINACRSTSMAGVSITIKCDEK